jgi:hypothetical protein
LSAALAARPASVQERWFSRIYFLKPIAFVILSLFWLITGLIAFGPGYRAGFELMHEAGDAAHRLPEEEELVGASRACTVSFPSVHPLDGSAAPTISQACNPSARRKSWRRSKRWRARPRWSFAGL